MNIKKIIAAALATLMSVAIFAGCSKDTGSSAVPGSDEKGVQSSATADAESSSDAQTSTKYGNAPTYQTEDGKTAAKTESGTEVELTGENLAKIYAEYEKVKGSGSDREKELLDQLQLILEASPNINQVQ